MDDAQPNYGKLLTRLANLERASWEQRGKIQVLEATVTRQELELAALRKGTAESVLRRYVAAALNERFPELQKLHTDLALALNENLRVGDELGLNLRQRMNDAVCGPAKDDR